MAFFKGLFSGLTQSAADDVNGLLAVLVFCLIDDGNYANYREWLLKQVLGNLSVGSSAVGQGIFTDLTQQAADRERRGIGKSLDDILWKMRQGEAW
jgi:hypothetical protein